MKKIKSIIKNIEFLLEQFPSGIDYEVDREEQSPDDVVSHISGLIWQEIQKIKGLLDEKN